MTKYGMRDGVSTVKKIIVQDKAVVQYIIPKTVAYSTGDILGGLDFNTSSVAITNVGLDAQPVYPMNIVVCANVAGTAGGGDIITVNGEDQFGDYVEENFIVKSTAAGTTAGSKAFGKVDGISVYAGESDTSTTIKSTDLGIGYHKTVGLPWPVESASDIISYAYDGAYATTAVDQLTISKPYNTLVLPAMAASKVVSVIYKSKVQR